MVSAVGAIVVVFEIGTGVTGTGPRSVETDDVPPPGAGRQRQSRGRANGTQTSMALRHMLSSGNDRDNVTPDHQRRGATSPTGDYLSS